MLNETGETNELAEAFEQVLRSDVTLLQQMRLLLNGRFPLLRAIAVRPRARGRERTLTRCCSRACRRR